MGGVSFFISKISLKDMTIANILSGSSIKLQKTGLSLKISLCSFSEDYVNMIYDFYQYYISTPNKRRINYMVGNLYKRQIILKEKYKILELESLYKRFFENNRVRIPLDILDDLSPSLLAILYMNNGKIIKGYNVISIY